MGVDITYTISWENGYQTIDSVTTNTGGTLENLAGPILWAYNESWFSLPGLNASSAIDLTKRETAFNVNDHNNRLVGESIRSHDESAADKITIANRTTTYNNLGEKLEVITQTEHTGFRTNIGNRPILTRTAF